MPSKKLFEKKISEEEQQNDKIVLLIDNIGKLAGNFLKTLDPKETYFDEEGESGIYKYYILYEVSSSQLTEAIKLYSSIFAK